MFNTAITPGATVITDTERGRLTARAMVMGVAFSIFNAYWVAVMEVRWYVLDGTCLPLFVTPVFVMLLLLSFPQLWRPAPSRPVGAPTVRS